MGTIALGLPQVDTGHVGQLVRRTGPMAFLGSRDAKSQGSIGTHDPKARWPFSLLTPLVFRALSAYPHL